MTVVLRSEPPQHFGTMILDGHKNKILFRYNTDYYYTSLSTGRWLLMTNKQTDLRCKHTNAPSLFTANVNNKAIMLSVICIMDIILLVRPLILLFWTSDNVYPRSQSQRGSPRLRALSQSKLLEVTNRLPRRTRKQNTKLKQGDPHICKR